MVHDGYLEIESQNYTKGRTCHELPSEIQFSFMAKAQVITHAKILFNKSTNSLMLNVRSNSKSTIVTPFYHLINLLDRTSSKGLTCIFA